MQKKVRAFREKKAGAESQKKTSLTGIQNEKEPDMESLKGRVSETENRQRKARETAEKYRGWKQEVSKVQEGLESVSYKIRSAWRNMTDWIICIDWYPAM